MDVQANRARVSPTATASSLATQLLTSTGFLATVKEKARGSGARQVQHYRVAFWVILAILVIASAARAIVA
jgi:hypothetical protein